MKKFLLAVPAVLASSAAMAADVPFTVTAPTFDFTVMGTVAASILGVAAMLVVYRRIKGITR